MPREACKCESLSEESGVEYGVIGVEMNKEIQRAFRDCADRPTAKSGRKITLTIEIKPLTDERGQLHDASVSINVASSLPKKGLELRMKAASDGLEYLPASAETETKGLFNESEE